MLLFRRRLVCFTCSTSTGRQPFLLHFGACSASISAYDFLLFVGTGAVSRQPSTLPLGVALPTLGDALRWAAAVLDAHFVTLAGQPKQALTALLALQVIITVDY